LNSSIILSSVELTTSLFIRPIEVIFNGILVRLCQPYNETNIQILEDIYG